MKIDFVDIFIKAFLPLLPWVLTFLVLSALLNYLGSLLKRKLKGGPTDLYEAIPYLLSEGEARFHESLYAAVGQQYLIYPKVGLSDIVDVRQSLAKSDWQSAWNRISQKHVDFVLCNPGDYRVLAIVELDDKSHQRRDRQDRDKLVDEILKNVGLPILHVRAARDYDPQQLADLIEQTQS